jgi:AcrR family transcriptional regulator
MSATERRIRAAAIRLFAERGHTDVSISDLAAEAGVARGTLYRQVASIDALFDQVRAEVAVELHAANVAVMDAAGITDPPRRLATGIRMLVRGAHADPALGHFLARFALSDESLRTMLCGPPMADVVGGISSGRYPQADEGELSVASLIMGATVSAIWMVLEGHQAWRDAGTDTAALVLRALGVTPSEAREISREPLPD